MSILNRLSHLEKKADGDFDPVVAGGVAGTVAAGGAGGAALGHQLGQSVGRRMAQSVWERNVDRLGALNDKMSRRPETWGRSRLAPDMPHPADRNAFLDYMKEKNQYWENRPANGISARPRGNPVPEDLQRAGRSLLGAVRAPMDCGVARGVAYN